MSAMTLRVRPARHYQHPRAPVRIAADVAAPPIARALSRAMKAAQTSFPEEQATYLLQNGRYGEIAGIIDWNHQNEAMKRPLSMLGDLWLVCAEIGERKINGAFTSRRRRVRYGKAAGEGERAAFADRYADAGVASAIAPTAPLLKDQSDLFNFDRFDPATQRKIRAYQDLFIRELSEGARGSVERAIMDGLRKGLPPEAIVTRIKRAIGLTVQQAAAVERFREQLIAGDRGALSRALVLEKDKRRIRAALDAGVPLDHPAIDRMVDRYEFSYRDYRALTIARTETTNAAAMGLQDAYEQAVARGAMPREAVRQFWQLALDEDTCKHCISVVDLNPDGVALGEPFDSDEGPVTSPGLHPNCRCSLEMQVDLSLVPSA